jgi:hypothetical protein
MRWSPKHITVIRNWHRIGKETEIAFAEENGRRVCPLTGPVQKERTTRKVPGADMEISEWFPYQDSLMLKLIAPGHD